LTAFKNKKLTGKVTIYTWQKRKEKHGYRYSWRKGGAPHPMGMGKEIRDPVRKRHFFFLKIDFNQTVKYDSFYSTDSNSTPD